MKGTTIFEIVIIVILAIAFVVFLFVRNIKDEEDNNPELTKALKDANKKKEERL